MVPIGYESMLKSELEPYKVDYLFLLMGDNPLPNYIAAISLLKSKGTAFLVHTARTKLQAQRLEKVLVQTKPFHSAYLIDLGDRQADAYGIGGKIREYAEGLSGLVGLNYTGGTKAMSVHTYRAIEKIYPKAVFSYLDSNSLEMYFDSDIQDSDRIKVSPQLSLSKMFQLHGLSWRVPPSNTPVIPKLAIKFAQLHQDPILAESWRKWCNQELRRKARTRDQKQWKEESELRKISPLNLQSLPETVQELLQDVGAKNCQLSLVTACEYGFSDYTSICEWFDGIWLEHFVLAQVQTVAKDLNIQESKMSFRIDEKSSQWRQWEKFEFDVAFVRNSQLFALSCTTTSDRRFCKQKLFEANTRARQLGGIEARVCLVCCNDYPDSLRSELEVETRDRKIAVLGRQDLGDLGQKIQRWVQQND